MNNMIKCTFIYKLFYKYGFVLYKYTLSKFYNFNLNRYNMQFMHNNLKILGLTEVIQIGFTISGLTKGFILRY